MNKTISDSKARFAAYRKALYDCDPNELPAALDALCSANCNVRLPFPIGDVEGAKGLLESGYGPLLHAIPDLERRDYIVAGAVDRDEEWIGCGGYYVGVFEKPWLDIPATGQLVTMRYIEFFRFDKGKIVEAKLLWDIPALMMQAGAWPMAPGLGVEMNAPGPATNDGILAGQSDAARSEKSMNLVNAMVEGLGRFAEGGAQAMQLERFWHPKMNWYGPAGIGSNRRISGFRKWHQIPFLKAMPDRSCDTQNGGYDCYFADGDYVLFCGWPGMKATITGDGWMGISPAGQEIDMTSLDIWRCENGLIRENWVMIDILDIWNQVGVDVFARMKELM
ncbi:MAG: ester cyclase [Gammaproteobacteria bacterium]|nr:ester cyclase [Gammaproteobacteria bacterium]